MQLQERLIHALHEGVIGIDRQGVIHYLNDQACRLLGLSSEEEGLQQPLSRLFRLSDNRQQQPFTEEPLFAALARGEACGPITQRYLHTGNNQSIPISYRLCPADDELSVLMFQHAAEEKHGSGSQAGLDPLTRLPDRGGMQRSLTTLHNLHQAESRPYTLALLDLDRFRAINDGYGHSTGDRVLQLAARNIREQLSPQDHLGRWGDDEFILLLPGKNAAQALTLAERIRGTVAESPFPTGDGQQVQLSLSTGLASYPEDSATLEELLGNASIALAEAKRRGRNRSCSSVQIGSEHFGMASRLDRALNQQQVRAAYQPIVEVKSGDIVADEALARIVLPEQAPIPAGLFIQTAEQIQIAHRIDHRIVRETILRCRDKIAAGEPSLAHFVNVSADLLRHPELVEDILAVAVESCTACFPAVGQEKPLVIEITERELLEDIEEAKRLLTPFIDFGLRLAIDDFGSGYSSLLYLADLPVSFLKLEGALVRRAPYEPRVRAILRGVQDLADELGLITIAEFVEDETTLACIRDIGIHWAQGYHFGRPELPGD